jgi:D-alanyl-D-alanine-carboxypeptidase/D-alanyl-D-alanine-endopeptidase
MFRKIFASLALCVVSASVAQAQEFAPDSSVRRILADRLASGRGMGFVLAIVERGKAPRYYATGASGVAGVRLDSSTVFEIGSITKVFTSALLADMVERGEVKLDDPISKYLPKTVRVPARKGKEITLLDLATQSSGLPRLPSNLRPASVANPYADYTVANLYEFLSAYTLTRDIASQYEYSNLGVGLLGHVLSLRGGKSYETLLKERILDPLAMHDTGIGLSASMESRMAQGFNANREPMTRWDLPSLAGAGALRSTASDMVKFLSASLDSSSSPLGKILSRIQVSQRPADRPDNTIGLGWHIVKVFGSTLTWHNGGTGGYRTIVGLDAANGRGVVLLTNSNMSPDDIAFHLLEPRVPLETAVVTPQSRKAVSLTEKDLEPLVGVYELAPAFRLTVTREGTNLYGQATGQARFQLLAEAPLKFFLRVVDAQVTFVAGPDGKVNSMVLHQGGANIPGKRVQ